MIQEHIIINPLGINSVHTKDRNVVLFDDSFYIDLPNLDIDILFNIGNESTYVKPVSNTDGYNSDDSSDAISNMILDIMNMIVF